MSRPEKVIEPAVGVTVPEMHLKSVVLPAPLGPTMDTKSPSAMAIDTPPRAVSPPYPACTFSSVSTSAPFPAEVGLDDARLARHGIRRALRQHGPVIQHDEAVREAHHGMHCMLDDDNGNPVGSELTDYAQHRLHFLHT